MRTGTGYKQYCFAFFLEYQLSLRNIYFRGRTLLFADADGATKFADIVKVRYWYRHHSRDFQTKFLPIIAILVMGDKTTFT